MKPTDIIFKAKRADIGEWIQGCLVDGKDIRGENFYKIEINKCHEYRCHEIDPNTLCIGFKDEAGNLWFTGDRVRFKSGKSGVIFLENFCLKIKIDGIFTPVPFSECNTPEIIGNIHD